MTDQEKTSEPFLERWSRKKIEAERETPDATAAKASTATPPGDAGPSEQAAQNPRQGPAMAAAKPEFDLASLPSLDSITASTDIRAFLAPGVPNELARAALRRAWSADPAIRDFVGLAENAWDFTAPDSIEGFGQLPPGYDVKKLVAQIFGESEKEADPGTSTGEPAAAAPAVEALQSTEQIASAADAVALPDSTPELDSPAADLGEQTFAALQPNGDFVHRDTNIATHNSNSSNEIEERKKRRPHGGALPQ